MDAVPRELARRARARHVRARWRFSPREPRRACGPRARPPGAVLCAPRWRPCCERRRRRTRSPPSSRRPPRGGARRVPIARRAPGHRLGRERDAPERAAHRRARDPRRARSRHRDADTALAAASSLRRRRQRRARWTTRRWLTAAARRAARAACGAAGRFAELGETAGRHALPFSRSHRRPSPPRRWRRGATSGTSWRTRVWRRNDRGGARGGARRRRRARRARAPLRRRRRRHGRRGGAGVETGGVPPGAVSPRGAPRARHRRVRRGGGVSGSGRAISRRVGGVRGGVSRARRRRARPPAPGDCADWRRVVEALVRAVAAHAECARARDAADAAAASGRAAAATATAAAAAAPAEASGLRRASPPPPPWRAPRCSAPASRRRSARARRRGRTRAWRTAVSPRWRTRSGIRGSARSRASGTVGWDSGRRNASGPAPGPRTRGARRSAWRCPARHPRCARKMPRRWRARRS